jgi:hypothetical protein
MSNSDIVKIRIKVGFNEAEIEGSLTSIKEALVLIPQLAERIAFQTKSPVKNPNASPIFGAPNNESLDDSTIQQLQGLEIVLEKSDSLADVISKIFRTQWGRQARRLSEIREALRAYGMAYPKQSVAVALLRLAQSGKLRRFKNESGEYVYTTSVALVGSEPGNVNLAPVASPP